MKQLVKKLLKKPKTLNHVVEVHCTAVKAASGAGPGGQQHKFKYLKKVLGQAKDVKKLYCIPGDTVCWSLFLEGIPTTGRVVFDKNGTPFAQAIVKPGTRKKPLERMKTGILVPFSTTSPGTIAAKEGDFRYRVILDAGPTDDPEIIIPDPSRDCGDW